MEAFDYCNDNNYVKRTDKYAGFIGGGVGGIKKLFRVVEICLVLVSVTWASSRLPFAVRISGEYFRWVVNVVVSHLFVFLLSNVIVLFLFFKSRHLFSQQDNNIITETQIDDFCQEFIETSRHVSSESSSKVIPEEIVVYQDKQTILELTTTEVRVHHRRSQSSSENIMIRNHHHHHDSCGDNCVKQLRRSETEKQMKVTAAEVVDELSNEEFQRAIDAFIAKQIKFHQQEKHAIIVPHASSCV